MTAPRVAVISGGPGAEHDVSLAGGRAIVAALGELRYGVIECRVSRDGEWRTDGRAGIGAAVAALVTADVAIPALHGPWGEDGTVQGFLETLGIPYVGSGVLASATCMDKARTKQVLDAAGIAVAPGRMVGRAIGAREAAALVDGLGLPLFVKPACGGSSYGVTRVTRARDLPRAVAIAGAYGAQVLVEPEIHGREIDVGILERPDGSITASPLLQIEPDPAEPFFTTAAKYGSSRTRFLVPAPVDPAVAEAVAATARRAFTALGCSGLARVDCFVDEVRGPVVNEVNTFPGFTGHSQFPRMWAAAGLPFSGLVATLVATALARRPAEVTAGVRHPDPASGDASHRVASLVGGAA